MTGAFLNYMFPFDCPSVHISYAEFHRLVDYLSKTYTIYKYKMDSDDEYINYACYLGDVYYGSIGWTYEKNQAFIMADELPDAKK